MAAINITDLNNAQLDVAHIADVATSVAATATDRLGNTKATVKAAVDSIKAFNARGAFAAGTNYAIKDLYTSGGITYVAVAAHLSTSVAADMAAGKVVIHQGATVNAIATPVTSAFGTFAEAMVAGAGKTLVVNTEVNITADTTIPSTVAIEVVKPGLFNVSAGVTLTISGDLKAGAYQIFGGSGQIVFAVTSRSADLPVWRGGGQTAVFSQSRTLLQSETEVGGPVHACEDNNTLIFTNPKAANFNAYAAFDANTTAGGPGEYDHLVAFQARQTYNGSGSVWVRMDSFVSRPVHTGTGAVQQMTGMRVQRPDGVGAVSNYYGILIEDPGARATGDNYAIYAAGGDILTRGSFVAQGDAGQPAAVRVRGNGQVGGFGLVLQSAGDSSAFVLNTANAPLKFGANNSEKMRLTAAGLLKIGAPTTVLTDNSLVEVQGAGGITLKATGGAGNACSLNWNHATAGDNLFSMFYTEATATPRGSIDYNRTGGLTRYNTTSDGTLKNIIGDASTEKSLEILASTRLRHYSWKDDPSGKVQIGPIAQELHETFPGAVSVGGWYEETIAAATEQREVSPATEAIPASAILDDQGTPLTPEIPAKEAVFETVVVSRERVEKRYRSWGVDKTAFSFHLVAGHQHHTKEIAELREAVAALTKRLAKLEKRP